MVDRNGRFWVSSDALSTTPTGSFIQTAYINDSTTLWNLYNDGSSTEVSKYQNQTTGQSHYVETSGNGFNYITFKLNGEGYLGYDSDMNNSGDIVIIGEPKYNEEGRVRVYELSGSSWVVVDQLVSLLPVNGEQFGISVAATSGAENVVVGVPGNNSSQNERLEIFTKSPTASSWIREASDLTPTRGTFGFGLSVSISDDGLTAVGGHPFDNFGNGFGGADFSKGSVTVFVSDGLGTWTSQQELTASDGHNYEQFGYDVSLSSDGNTLAVGAFYEGPDKSSIVGSTPGYSLGSKEQYGAVYIFERSGSTWSQSKKLVAGTRQLKGWFGQSVKLSPDGTKLFVGEPSGGDTINNTPKVHIFEKGAGWSSVSSADQVIDGVIGEGFGRDIDVNSDVTKLLIGADLSAGGYAYLYIWNGSSYALSKKIIPVDQYSAPTSRFGFDVSISDGVWFGVGDWFQNPNDGSYYLLKQV